MRFKKLKELLKDRDLRYALVGEFPHALARDVWQELQKQHSPAELLLAEELDSRDVTLKLSDSRAELILLDASHCADLREVGRLLKKLLRLCSQSRILVLSPMSLEEVQIPNFFGDGKSVNWGDVASSEEALASRGDAALLRHSRRLQVRYGLKDLVLGNRTTLKFQEAIEYIKQKDFCEKEWGFRKRHSRGHGVTLLFHGESGTGKTMAAEVLASAVGMPLYQVDLSSIMSKWVGETEKNLKAIFQAAEGVRGILLFDEGDALFSSRTDINSSQDRYSNLEVNYLLQELETFSGVAVLSTNHTKNVDPAFLRRFTYSLTFGYPTVSQRELIWKANLPPEMPVATTVDFRHLSEFELSGGMIRNTIRHAASQALSRKHPKVEHEDFLWAIKRELEKHDLAFLREQVGEQFWRKVGPDWESVRK